MAKQITRIVLTGGPAAGKTTLISRILKEFKSDDGWKVITIPETATEMISGFGIGPFPNCMSMEDFQYYVVADQLHKEQLALKAAQAVPEEKVLIVYDRAVFDDKAYVSDEFFEKLIAQFGLTESELLGHYDAVLHLVTCAKGAEYAYNYGNAARYESIEDARKADDNTLRAWSGHHALYVIDNSVDPYITSRDFYLQYVEGQVIGKEGIIEAQKAKDLEDQKNLDSYMDEIDE